MMGWTVVKGSRIDRVDCVPTKVNGGSLAS